MQIIKYIGIILLSCSISCCGVIYSSRLKGAHRLRKEVIALLRDIERGIIHGRIPISVVLCNFPDGILKDTGFCQKITQASDTHSVIDECFAILTGEDKKTLEAFFSQLGKSQSSQCELQNVRYVIDYFEKTQPSSESEMSGKASLYKKISIISALLVAIILI